MKRREFITLLGGHGWLTCGQRLHRAEADITPPREGSGFDPERSLAEPQSRTAASP